jgi:hypothetical protein
MRAGTVMIAFGVSLLLLGALADKVAEGREPERETAPVARLVWIDVQGIAADVRFSAQAEVKDLLAPAGLLVSWPPMADADRVVEPGDTQIVILREAPRSLGPRVMGAAPQGAGARTVWVYLASVRAELGLSSNAVAKTQVESARVGRAVGRVIVHELIHTAAPDRPHDAGGLMCAHLDRSALESPTLPVERTLWAVLQAMTVRPPEVVDPPEGTAANSGGAAPAWAVLAR